MPIALKCQCGKQLNVRDEFAGKAVKCPACNQPLRVPAAGQAAPARPAAKPRPAAAPATSGGGDLDDLFAEEGMDQVVAQACPACGVPMTANAILCTKCGYNTQTGERLEGHKVAGVDIDMGTMALEKAASDIERDKALQEKMLGKAGMPPWMLALVLSILAGAVGIATLAVNASRREESIGFSPMATFLSFRGCVVLGCCDRFSALVDGCRLSKESQPGSAHVDDCLRSYLWVNEPQGMLEATAGVVDLWRRRRRLAGGRK